MGKKYNMTRLSMGGYVETVELEEIEEETVPEKQLWEKIFYFTPCNETYSKRAVDVAVKHFKEHPEELGLVSIREVLNVFDEANLGKPILYTNESFARCGLEFYKHIGNIRNAIEGMGKDVRMEKSIADGIVRQKYE